MFVVFQFLVPHSETSRKRLLVIAAEVSPQAACFAHIALNFSLSVRLQKRIQRFLKDERGAPPRAYGSRRRTAAPSGFVKDHKGK